MVKRRQAWSPQCVAVLVLVGCGTYDEAARALLRSTLEQRLGDADRDLVAVLQSRLAHESEPAVRDAILGELGAMFMKAESHDVIDDVDPGAPALPADDAGHIETWNDVLRLQRENVEPAAFAGISAPVLMIHGEVDPHPGAATRDTLRAFIPNLEYMSLDRCGHEPWRERHARERFIETIRQWLNKSLGAGAAVAR